MEAVRRLTSRLHVVFANGVATPSDTSSVIPVLKPKCLLFSSAAAAEAPPSSEGRWLFAVNRRVKLPTIVKAGDPILHEPAREVDPTEIKSERVQNIIDEMIQVMRKAYGVGLAAPQIGIPLRIICLEDKKELIRYHPEEEMKAQDRRAFDLLVILNPKLKKKSKKLPFFLKVA